MRNWYVLTMELLHKSAEEIVYGLGRYIVRPGKNDSPWALTR